MYTIATQKVCDEINKTYTGGVNVVFFKTPKGCILSLRKWFVMNLTRRTRGVSMFFSDTERLYTIATQTVCDEFNKTYTWDVNVFFFQTSKCCILSLRKRFVMNLTRRTRRMLVIFKTPKGCILLLHKRFVMDLTRRTRGMSMFFFRNRKVVYIRTLRKRFVMNLTRRTCTLYTWDVNVFFQTPKGCILSLRKRFVMSLTSRTREMSMFFSSPEPKAHR